MEVNRLIQKPWLDPRKLWGVVWSLILLVPCFWHSRIAAGDLGSHVYNAWIYNLIIDGQVEGYELSGQLSNVLFDAMLSTLGRLWGYSWAERLSVSVAVLVFFWGGWHWIRIVTGRRPWAILPVLAMVTYGWTFHAGFFNFYFSIGFAFIGFSLFYAGSFWRYFGCILCASLAFVAHPLGLIWLFGGLIYTLISSSLGWRGRVILLGGIAAGLVLVRLYIRYRRFFALRPVDPLWFLNGADQVVLGSAYWIVAILLLAVGLWALAVNLQRWHRQSLAPSMRTLPVELYLITLMVVLTQPSTLHLPLWSGTTGFILERLTLISAVLICGILALLHWTPLQRWLIGAVALGFFALVYADTNRLNLMEDRIAALVRTIPKKTRVLATFESTAPGSRMQFNWHMVDRACVGHCFSYSNYEPSTGQFRIRAHESNRNVMIWNVGDAMAGNYVVKPSDLPVYQIWQSPTDQMSFGIGPLAVGVKNGSSQPVRR